MQECLEKEVKEEELIKRAINEDSQSFLILFHQYCPIIYKIRNKSYIQLFDLDDWLQEGKIIFMETLMTYNRSKSVPLGAYFKLNFERHVCNLIRRQQAQKRKGALETVSLEYCIESIGDTVFQCREDPTSYEESVELRETLSGFLPRLSSLEKEVLYAELEMDQFIKSTKEERPPCWKNAKNRMKRKLKDFLESEC